MTHESSEEETIRRVAEQLNRSRPNQQRASNVASARRPVSEVRQSWLRMRAESGMPPRAAH